MVPEHLASPLHWKTPRRIFVNSMSDLFHENLTNEEIAAVFGVMAACPQHTFQCLTKRSKRMRAWFEWVNENNEATATLACEALARISGDDKKRVDLRDAPWPLGNVWVGVSTENQDTAEERIPDLLHIPAVVRFISAEPLLGPLDLIKLGSFNGELRRGEVLGHIEGTRFVVSCLAWIIAGCESGPSARPCDYRWLRQLRDQCAGADVPYFLKQARCAIEDGPGITTGPRRRAPNVVVSGGVGSRKKAGGVFELPYLDGVQHKAFPKNGGLS